MLIPLGKIALVLFTPTDANGQPAELDGAPTFELTTESEGIVELRPGDAPNQFRLKALSIGEAAVVISGDALLGAGYSGFEHTCEVSVYNEAEGGTCQVVALEPIVDE